VADAHRFKARERSIVPLLNPVRRGISLDDEERRSLRNEMGVEREGALLVSVGRLAPEKGIADLLRAIAIVRSTQPSVRLALAGTGDLDEPLRALVSQLGLEGSVRLLGWRDDVRRLLAASDVYVSASYWEGLPMAILEAMASALPIVATGVGEIPSLLAEQRGVVVPPGDVDGLADALGRLVAEPDRRRRLGDAAQRYVNQHCAVDEWGQRVLALYRSVNPSLLWPAPSGRTPEHTPPCAG
jgi:L-malate glycosyltransferase